MSKRQKRIERKKKRLIQSLDNQGIDPVPTYTKLPTNIHKPKRKK